MFYKNNNYGFNDWFPVICPWEENLCLMSFACDDSVYLYKNGVKEKAFLCKSRYIDGFVPFDDPKASTAEWPSTPKKWASMANSLTAMSPLGQSL